jgi:hypothetical protein
VHQELLKKQKTARPSGRRFQSSGGDLFGEFPHHTSLGTFVPDQGTLALHCQVARPVSESFLMLLGIVSSPPPEATAIYVIAKQPDRAKKSSRRRSKFPMRCRSVGSVRVDRWGG